MLRCNLVHFETDIILRNVTVGVVSGDFSNNTVTYIP